MSASLAAVTEETPKQQDFFDASLYQDNLFSLGSANNHATERDFKAGQYVEFKGSGTVVECVLKGFGSDKVRPQKVYKVVVNYAELI